MKLRIFLVSIFALVLSACNATSNTSFRDRNLAKDRDTAIFIDAKQRAILTRVYRENSNETHGIRRFCSEPSPDFVSVMAQSLAAGGSFGQSADPASIEIAAQLAFSRAENGTTIARTQTINMLRELMFRTCERFLSGGYDEMELSIQAVRDQRLMVSILAIEQLTGVVLPNPVVVNASGSASAGLGEEAIKTFAKLRDEKKAAETAQKTAQDAYDKEWKAKDDDPDKACNTNKKAYDAAGDDAAKKKPLEEKKGECDALKSALVGAEAKTKEATEAYDIVKKAMETGGVSAQTVTNAIANGGLSRATTQATKDVADTVERIVEMNFSDQTETMLFCLRTIRKADEIKLPDEQKKILTEQCIRYLEKDIEVAIARRQVALDTFGNFNRTSFDIFWNGVSARGGLSADPVRMQAVLGRAFVNPAALSGTTRAAINAMASVNTREQAQTIFKSFAQPDRLALARAVQ